jgi:hypothetical protein
MRFTPWLIVGVSSLLIAGCKIRIEVPEGGNVTTVSGAYSCSSGKACDIDVVDTFFDETFIAEPANGYEFKNWKKRSSGLCAGTEPTPCRLFTSFYESFPALMAILESDSPFYLEPVFERMSQETSSISGTWSGEGFDSSGPGSIRWTLRQSGGSFSGSVYALDYNTGTEFNGSVSGTISGGSITFDMEIPKGGISDPQFANCSVSVSGTGTVSNSSITLSYSGLNSCFGPVQSNTFQMTKQ